MFKVELTIEKLENLVIFLNAKKNNLVQLMSFSYIMYEQKENKNKHFEKM